MASSLNIGTTGLGASQKQLDIIGNNLANSSTVGYKTADITFASMLSQSLSGGGQAVGQGVSVADILTNFSQGSFETTSNVTDLAIDGNGFFIVKDAEGNSLYTRAGAFHTTNTGLLSDTLGYSVQGHMYDAEGILESQSVSALNLQSSQSRPTATTYFGIGATLDTETATGETFNSSQFVYDSQGAKHELNTVFRKMESQSYWAVQALLDGTNATSQTYSGLKFGADGTLDKVYTSTITSALTSAAGTFSSAINNVGNLYKDTLSPIVLTKVSTDSWTIASSGGYANATLDLGIAGIDDTVSIDLDGVASHVLPDITFTLGGTWANGDQLTLNIAQTESAIANSDVRFHASLGTLVDGATIGTDGVVTWNLTGLTNHDAPPIQSFATTSRISSLENDGYATGLLSGLTINKDGIVEGVFTNGQRQDMARILLSDFANLQGLGKRGSYFLETGVSGPAVYNKPGVGGVGTLQSNSLEMSNTDTAKEFIKMISAQRAYQSNAKIISTADQMLQVLMNVKQ